MLCEFSAQRLYFLVVVERGVFELWRWGLRGGHPVVPGAELWHGGLEVGI